MVDWGLKNNYLPIYQHIGVKLYAVTQETVLHNELFRYSVVYTVILILKAAYFFLSADFTLRMTVETEFPCNYLYRTSVAKLIVRSPVGKLLQL